MIQQWQLRALRASTGWSQGQLAKKASLSQAMISELENGEVDNPGTKVMNAIIGAFEAEGFFPTETGIERKQTTTFEIEGEDCYLRLLKQIADELSAGDVFLKSSADERRSSPEVIAQLQDMRDLGIVSQTLLRPGDTYFMGEPDEYRWLDKRVHGPGDVKIIYADCSAYLTTWASPLRIVGIRDKTITAEARRTFEYFWQNADGPEVSTAPARFNGVRDG